MVVVWMVAGFALAWLMLAQTQDDCASSRLSLGEQAFQASLLPAIAFGWWVKAEAPVYQHLAIAFPMLIGYLLYYCWVWWNEFSYQHHMRRLRKK